ncbi:MAG TPA: hypothetical protein VFU15_05655, partial [Bacteroidia bacterium]|nr:hypothetical protein [Bacteroidia bacterium]
MPPKDLKVAAIQAMLHWEDRDANLKMFDRLLDTITESVDLIVLPEMFTTGFSMSPEKLGKNTDGEALSW